MSVIYAPGQRTEVTVPSWFPDAFEQLGDRIREARTEAGVSQSQMCRDLAFTGPQLSRYENGHNVPSVLVLASIALYLNVHLDWLVMDAGVKGR